MKLFYYVNLIWLYKKSESNMKYKFIVCQITSHHLVTAFCFDEMKPIQMPLITSYFMILNEFEQSHR